MELFILGLTAALAVATWLVLKLVAALEKRQ
jgi:hypothetical protein